MSDASPDRAWSLRHSGTHSSPGKWGSPRTLYLEQTHGLESEHCVPTATKKKNFGYKEHLCLDQVPACCEILAEFSDGWVPPKGDWKEGSQEKSAGLLLYNWMPSRRINHGIKSFFCLYNKHKNLGTQIFLCRVPDTRPAPRLTQQPVPGWYFRKESSASVFTPHKLMHLLFFFQAVHLCDEVAGDVAFLPGAEGFCQPPLPLTKKK